LARVERLTLAWRKDEASGGREGRRDSSCWSPSPSPPPLHTSVLGGETSMCNVDSDRVQRSCQRSEREQTCALYHGASLDVCPPGAVIGRGPSGEGYVLSF
jgi:hypothetical protein